MNIDTQKIIDTLAALRSALRSGEKMTSTLDDMTNDALMEVRRARPAPQT